MRVGGGLGPMLFGLEVFEEAVEVIALLLILEVADLKELLLGLLLGVGRFAPLLSLELAQVVHNKINRMHY